MSGTCSTRQRPTVRDRCVVAPSAASVAAESFSSPAFRQANRQTLLLVAKSPSGAWLNDDGPRFVAQEPNSDGQRYPLSGQLCWAPTEAYRARTSRSASSSQAVAARSVSSRAGIPFGKSVRSRRSRSTFGVPSALLREAVVELLAALCPADLREAAAELRRRALVPVFRVARLEAARRLRFAPTTPCTTRRCAPRPAARWKVRPHSGQVSASPAALFRSFALFVVAKVFISCREGGLALR